MTPGDRGYFFVRRHQFLINFDKQGLDPRLRHCISSFVTVIDMILWGNRLNQTYIV